MHGGMSKYHAHTMQVQAGSHHATIVLNRCRAKLRMLHSLHQSRHRLCHNIANMSDCDGISMQQKSFCRLSTYEINLLRNGDKLRRHYDSLQEAAGVVRECREAQDHAHMFFQWLGSICQQDKPSGPTSQGQVVFCFFYLAYCLLTVLSAAYSCPHCHHCLHFPR